MTRSSIKLPVNNKDNNAMKKRQPQKGIQPAKGSRIPSRTSFLDGECRTEQFAFTTAGYDWQHPKRAGRVISKASDSIVSFKEGI
jgi:hypothetical protein